MPRQVPSHRLPSWLSYIAASESEANLSLCRSEKMAVASVDSHIISLNPADAAPGSKPQASIMALVHRRIRERSQFVVVQIGKNGRRQCRQSHYLPESG